jgi:hypothetical protein
MDTEYLKDWKCDDEQAKADFIEYLYRYYERSDGLYTGLWDRFKADVAKAARAQVSQLGLSIEDVLWGLK